MAFVLTLALVGCGGGGSGGSDAGTPAPVTSSRDVPLQLTAANSAQATRQAFQFGGVTLSLAQLAVDWTALSDAAGGAPSTSACAAGGSLTVTLLDRDANHRVSVGDRLTITVDNCYLRPLEDSFSGTLTIDVTAPAPTQQQAGTINFGMQFDVSNTGTSTIRLGGGLRYDYSADRLAHSIHVASTGQRFTVFASQGSTSYTEAMTQLDAARTVRRDTARAVTTMRLHLASDLLGGALDATTTTPWSAWFDSFPDAGELSVSGASGQTAQLQASVTGSGTIDVLFGGALVNQIAASDAVSPYLWSATDWFPAAGNELGYLTQPASALGFRLLSQPTSTTLLPQSGALTWSYSRPLAAGTLANAMFVPTGSLPGQIGASVQVPATVVIEGALLSVTPTSQLVPGMNYDVWFDNGAIAPIADTSGATLPRPAFSGSVALTISASARIVGSELLFGPTGVLELDASASTAPGGSIALTHWSQVSGPPLIIVGGDTPIATVSPASGSGNGRAVVEVEVRNAAGDAARTQLAFPVVADPTQTLVMAYRADTATTTIQISDPASGPPYVHYFAGPNVVDLMVTARLLASLPAGTPWMTGVDVAYGAGGTPGVNVVWNPPGSVCASPSGHLKVLDYAVDAGGSITRVAIDFEETCAGVTTTGSVRFGSAIDLRP